MKKNGFTPVLILIIIAILGVIGYFGYKNYNQTSGYKTYKNTELGISLNYPSTWDVSVLGKDALTYPGIYFSPEKFDFGDADGVPTAGYVRITVFDNSDIKNFFLTSKYKSKTYDNAQQLLDDLIQEQKEYVGPPRSGSGQWESLSLQKPFLTGAVSVGGTAETVDNGDFLYWIVRDGKLYEFLVNYPKISKDRSDFDKKVDVMTSSFKFEE